jgi:hypothetical protein
VQTLVEDFLQYLRHERGQSDNTAKTYAALLGKFTAWAAKLKLTDWQSVELKHLMAFLSHERSRNLLPVGRASSRAASDSDQADDGSRGLGRRPPSSPHHLKVIRLRAMRHGN